MSWPRHSLASPSATPQLARLARSGLVLDNIYTLPICSPSRAAILTGVYPFRMGLQVSRVFILHSFRYIVVQFRRLALKFPH